MGLQLLQLGKSLTHCGCKVFVILYGHTNAGIAVLEYYFLCFIVVPYCHGSFCFRGTFCKVFYADNFTSLNKLQDEVEVEIEHR